MATINTNGIIPTDLSGYITQLNNIFLNVFGMSFNTDPETPQGQLIGLLAFALSQVDNSIVDAVAGTVLPTAAGQQLDNIAINLGIKRKEAVNTEVNCVLTGVPSTLIPAGSQASDIYNRVFYLKENVTIGDDLTGNGIMVSVTPGGIVVGVNEITNIITSVAGWETINNNVVGVTGTATETDSEFYRRYIASIPRNSRTQISSIRTALLEIPDVKQALVQDNDQSDNQIFKGITIPPHSVSCYVLGGSEDDIFVALGEKKPTGVPYNGSEVGHYNDLSTYTFLTVKFDRAEQIAIKINLTIRTQLGFPSDGIAQIKQNIVNFFNGLFPNNQGGFFQAQQIAQDVIWSRLFTPINAVQSHEVLSLTIGKSGDPLAAADIEILLNQIATVIMSDITVLTA